MKTKITLAALVAMSAAAHATPGQIHPVTTPKTKHVVRVGHLAEIHSPSLQHVVAMNDAKAQQRTVLTHPATSPGPK